MAVIFTLLSLYVKGETLTSIFKTGILFAISFIAGLVIFKTLIMVPASTYVSNTIPPLNKLPVVFTEHMKHYYKDFIKLHFSVSFRNHVILGFIFLIILSVIHSKNNKLIALLLSVVTLILGAILTYGFYAILEKPLFACRSAYGIGALIACVFIFTVSFKDWYITKIISLVIAWSFVVFASAYGNALVAQKEWENFRMEEVVYDLATVENKGQNFKYKLTGWAGLAPKISLLKLRYPVLNSLIPLTYGNSDWEYGTKKFEYFYGLKNMTRDESITDTGNPQIVKETMYHQIKVFNDKVLINLK